MCERKLFLKLPVNSKFTELKSMGCQRKTSARDDRHRTSTVLSVLPWRISCNKIIRTFSATSWLRGLRRTVIACELRWRRLEYFHCHGCNFAYFLQVNFLTFVFCMTSGDMNNGLSILLLHIAPTSVLILLEYAWP